MEPESKLLLQAGVSLVPGAVEVSPAGMSGLCGNVRRRAGPSAAPPHTPRTLQKTLDIVVFLLVSKSAEIYLIWQCHFM